MIMDEIKDFAESLSKSDPSQFEKNSENFCKLLTKISTPRVYKSFSSIELAGVYGGLCWLSENSGDFAEVIDETLLTGDEFDGSGVSLYTVLDLMLSQEEFPDSALNFYLENPKFFEFGFTEPSWIATRKLSERTFYRLWNVFSVNSPDFQKGYREKIQENPNCPKDLRHLSIWEEY